MTKVAKAGSRKKPDNQDVNSNKIGLFDIITDLISKKQGIAVVDGELDKSYLPFLINRAISMHVDLVLFANEMNIAHQLDKRIQHDFYFYGIDKKYRKSDWAKQWKKSEDEDFQAVQEYFDFGDSKTKAALRILTSDQIDEIKRRVCKGGKGDKEND